MRRQPTKCSPHLMGFNWIYQDVMGYQGIYNNQGYLFDCIWACLTTRDFPQNGNFSTETTDELWGDYFVATTELRTKVHGTPGSPPFIWAIHAMGTLFKRQVKPWMLHSWTRTEKMASCPSDEPLKGMKGGDTCAVCWFIRWLPSGKLT